MSSSRKRSAVWNHFDEIDPKRAKCSYCANTLCISGGNVGNLNRHLKTKHPTVPLNTERQDMPVTTAASQVESEQLSSTSSVSQVPLVQGPKINGPQTSMTDFVHSMKPLGPRRSEKIDEQLIKMIAKGHHAFSLVEEPEFKEFVSMLCPGYSLPTRKTLSDSLLPKMYERELTKAKAKVQAGQAICLTTDAWTSDNNEGFIAVTGHYITECKLQSTMLGCVEYAERHTAENLAEFLKNIAQEWNISNKITAVASDNAANVTAAIKTGGWRQVPCFAHTLNLCVQNALAAIEETTTNVKQVVVYFKRSSQALAKLQDIQRQLNVPLLKLKQDVVTRWNSTYDMLRRFSVTRNAICATLALTRPDLLLSSADWMVLEAAVPILKPFYDVTVEMSAEKNVSLSKIIPLCSILLSNARQQLSQQHPLPELTKMLELLKEELEKRFGFIEYSELHVEAALLDPRFKDKGFQDPALAKKALDSLKLRIGRQRPTSTPQLDAASRPSTSSSRQPLQESESSSIWAAYDQKVRNLRPTNPTAAGIVELEKYMQEPMLSRTSDPLQWWHERRFIYPLLYSYTLKRLNVVATSVPCERVFSKAGNILNDRRRRLKSKKLSQLLFISCNC